MRYTTTTPSMHFIVRVNRGEDVLAALTRFCQEHKIYSGSIHGIGAADEIELAHYSVETKKYTSKTFTGEHEVANLSGIITDKKVHIHATIANNQFETFAGHLSRMRISGACEIHLFAGEEPIGRVKDEETGLELLDI